jgi:hypothetical protein
MKQIPCYEWTVELQQDFREQSKVSLNHVRSPAFRRNSGGLPPQGGTTNGRARKPDVPRWKVDPPAGAVSLELEDLAGFDGRCDAILFVKDATDDYRPPNTDKELAEFRRERLGLPENPADAGEYDLVVAGGGYAGTCAAIAAARLGLTVALIQDRPVLGGNASSEIRLGPIGSMQGIYRLDDIIREIHQGDVVASGGVRPRPDDKHVLKLVRAEKNISLHLETHVFAVEKQGPRITAVVARHTRTAKELRFRGSLFADCTGDATVGYLAGADWRMGREGSDETGETLAPPKADRLLMGMSNFWWARQTDRPCRFPACPWALEMQDLSSFEVSSPKYPPKFKDYAYVGGWNWESGFRNDPIAEVEAVRDHNLRAIFGAWDYLQNRSPDKDRYASAKLDWVAFVAGKRESRRLLGDVILQEQDLTTPNVYPDGCVVASWYFDMPNLFMAGRNISATHVGLLPVRVMNTTAMMGTVVGRAAWLCRKKHVDPRAIYQSHWDEFTEILRNPNRTP